jgi:hypothetical protein
LRIVLALYSNTTERVCKAPVERGSAQIFIDLHTYLAAGYTESVAYAVDEVGNVVGAAVNSSGVHSIVWQYAP